MATIRVNKNKNYTVMSNYHLQDKNLSLKAKGILSLMLSLPDNWDYSIEGLATLSKDGKDSIITALHELEQNGYLVRTQNLNEKGQFNGYIYDIYEMKQTNTEQPFTEKPNTEEPTQINNNKEIIKKQNTKHIYGEYKHVRLTDEEHQRLIKDYGFNQTNEAIQYLDEYIEMKGASYKNHNLVLRKWVYEAVKSKKQIISREYTQKQFEEMYDSLDDIKV